MPPIGPGLLLRLALVLGMSVGACLLPSPAPVAASVGMRGPAADESADEHLAETEAAFGFLHALVHEINGRRAWVGHQPVGIAPMAANAGVTRYLADLTPPMLAAGACFHGNGDPIPPAWEYVARSGFRAPGSGEVMTCPAGDGFWTASRIADSWWKSGLHHTILYADPSVNLVACGAIGPLRGRAAYTTTACVTFHI